MNSTSAGLVEWGGEDVGVGSCMGERGRALLDVGTVCARLLSVALNLLFTVGEEPDLLYVFRDAHDGLDHVSVPTIVS